MPTYQVTSPSGQKLQVTGDSAPSEQELDQIFSQVGSSPPSQGHTNQQPQPQSLLQKADSFAKNANDKFLGGILQGGANLVKLVDPSAGTKLSNALNKDVIQPDASPSAAGQAGQKVGSILKDITETVGTLPLAAEEAGAGAAGKAAEIAKQAIGGAAVSGADTGSRKQAAEGALTSGALSAGTEAASATKNALRSILGKTSIGQVFGNASKDVTAGLMGKGQEYVEAASQYMQNLEKAEQQSPEGVKTNDLVKNVISTLDSGKAGSFNVKGGGPAGIYALHPEDRAVLQKVVDYVNGGKMPSSQALENALGEAKSVADAYGIPLKSGSKSLEDKLASIVGSSRSVSKYGTNQPNLNSIASDMAKSLKPVLDQGGNIPLDFEKSVFKTDPAAKKRISTVWNDVWQTTGKGNASVQDLDALKQRVGEMVKKTAPAVGQDATKENALYTKLYNSVSKSISDSSPAYAQAMKDYQGYLAGKGMSSFMPKSMQGKLTGGSIAALALYLHNPMIAVAELASSPKASGITARAAGAANRAGGTVTVPIANAIRKSPTGMAQLAKILGIGK